MTREWTRKQIKMLVVDTLNGRKTDEIAKDLRACRKTVLDMQRELGLREAKRERWNDKDIALVRELYELTPTADIAARLGRPHGSVWQMAHKLGLSKSKKLIADTARERTMRPDHGGRKSRFAPGVVPHNKGLKMPGWAVGRMAETQFKKGSKPQTWRPIGTERLTKEGYLQRKVADTGNTVEDYVEVHRLMWEEAHGLIPEGCVIVFKDGDRKHLDLKNFEVITRGELARRNTIHKLPEPLKQVIRLNASIKRRIRKIDAQKQTDGPAESSLRNARSA